MHHLTQHFFKVLFVFAVTLGSANSYAENSKEFGDYVVHYNAFRSDTISPEIAKQYGGGGHMKAAGFTVATGWEGEKLLGS